MADKETAAAYGLVNMNSVFVKASRPRRLGKTSFRISPADIFWMIVVLLPSAGLLLLLGWLLGKIPGIGDYFGWYVVVLSPFIAFFLGRFLSAKINPYGKDSGETLRDFLDVLRDNYLDKLAWWAEGQTIVEQEVETCAKGRRKTEAGTVWIGTARAQHTPYSPLGLNDDGTAKVLYFELASRTMETDYLNQAVEKQRATQRHLAVPIER